MHAFVPLLKAMPTALLAALGHVSFAFAQGSSYHSTSIPAINTARPPPFPNTTSSSSTTSTITDCAASWAAHSAATELDVTITKVNITIVTAIHRNVTYGKGDVYATFDGIPVAHGVFTPTEVRDTVINVTTIVPIYETTTFTTTGPAPYCTSSPEDCRKLYVAYIASLGLPPNATVPKITPVPPNSPRCPVYYYQPTTECSYHYDREPEPCLIYGQNVEIFYFPNKTANSTANDTAQDAAQIAAQNTVHTTTPPIAQQSAHKNETYHNVTGIVVQHFYRNITFTSPTLYLSYDYLRAESTIPQLVQECTSCGWDGCFTSTVNGSVPYKVIQTQLPAALLAVPPENASTMLADYPNVAAYRNAANVIAHGGPDFANQVEHVRDLYHVKPRPLDVNRLEHPRPTDYYLKPGGAPGCNESFQTPECRTIFEGAYRPVLSLPHEVKGFQGNWSSCVPAIYGDYAQPMALTNVRTLDVLRSPRVLTKASTIIGVSSPNRRPVTTPPETGNVPVNPTPPLTPPPPTPPMPEPTQAQTPRPAPAPNVPATGPPPPQPTPPQPTEPQPPGPARSPGLGGILQPPPAPAPLPVNTRQEIAPVVPNREGSTTEQNAGASNPTTVPAQGEVGINPGGGSANNPGGGSANNPGGGSENNPGGGAANNPGGGSANNAGGGAANNAGGPQVSNGEYGNIIVNGVSAAPGAVVQVNGQTVANLGNQGVAIGANTFVVPGNAGNTPGSNTGGNPGSNPGGNIGNPGGNTEGNPGGNTGGNPGEEFTNNPSIGSATTVNVGGNTYTISYGPQGEAVVNGQTIEPGGSAVISGQVVQNVGGSAIAVNGQVVGTSGSPGAVGGNGATAVINGQTFSIASAANGAVVVNGITASPGQTIEVNGQSVQNLGGSAISVDGQVIGVSANTGGVAGAGGTTAVINGQTFTFSSAGNGAIVVNGLTASPGQTIQVNGQNVQNLGGSAIAVNGQIVGVPGSPANAGVRASAGIITALINGQTFAISSADNGAIVVNGVTVSPAQTVEVNGQKVQNLGVFGIAIGSTILAVPGGVPVVQSGSTVPFSAVTTKVTASSPTRTTTVPGRGTRTSATRTLLSTGRSSGVRLGVGGWGWLSVTVMVILMDHIGVIE
ncbi:Ribonuclease H protein [Teratosphaeria destructans]|uniref:Ribonuclease H protein n=1 Tax=Teratosphaeria destructans TaxID=418781 RepID=A0A9W7W2J3_9PEZI|nr:Ribonuclease H protein [Teratosphaeria destructans]